MVALQQIAGDDGALHTGHLREWKTAARDSVARCVDRRIGNALEVLVYRDAAFVPGDTSCLQVEVVDLWDPAGAVHCHVRLESTRLVPRGSMDNDAVTPLFNAFHMCVQVDVHTELAGSPYKTVDEVRIEALERACTTVDDLDLGAGASRNMSELESDIATSHEDDLARQPVEL